MGVRGGSGSDVGSASVGTCDGVGTCVGGRTSSIGVVGAVSDDRRLVADVSGAVVAVISVPDDVVASDVTGVRRSPVCDLVTGILKTCGIRLAKDQNVRDPLTDTLFSSYEI